MKIKLVNKQNIDGQTDLITEEAEGKYLIKDDKKFIIYKVEEEGIQTSVMITVSKDDVTVKRTSSVQTILFFNRNEHRNVKYHTPYGEMYIKITTDKMVNALDENGGKLRLIYTMDMQGQKIYNDMQITVN